MTEWTTEEEAANLKRLLSAVENKAKFAQNFKVPGGPSMLSQHTSGHRPINLEAASAYAKGLQVSLYEISPRLVRLISDLPPLMPGDNPGDAKHRRSLRLYPVISFAQAAGVGEGAGLPRLGDALDVELGKETVSARSFFLQIEDDSMAPEFREGDRVLIDPDARPQPGDCVAAKSPKQVLFRKYRLRGISACGEEVFELVPFNEDHPVMGSDEHELSVIGAMLELRRKFARS